MKVQMKISGLLSLFPLWTQGGEFFAERIIWTEKLSEVWAVLMHRGRSESMKLLVNDCGREVCSVEVCFSEGQLKKAGCMVSWHLFLSLCLCLMLLLLGQPLVSLRSVPFPTFALPN